MVLEPRNTKLSREDIKCNEELCYVSAIFKMVAFLVYTLEIQFDSTPGKHEAPVQQTNL